jgi:hypothetical protein
MPPLPPSGTSARRGDAAGAKAAMRGYVRRLAKASKECSPKCRALTKRQVSADTLAAVRVLSEAVAVTVAVLQRVTSSLSARVVDAARKTKWCVVSKLFGSDCSLGGAVAYAMIWTVMTMGCSGLNRCCRN